MSFTEKTQIAELVLEYIKVLVWPLVVTLIVCIFRKHLVNIINRLKNADLPGGIKINLQETIQETQKLSDIVREFPLPDKQVNFPSIPITEANARMLKLGLQPSPSGVQLNHYRSLAKQDPNLALAGLRMEIEILIKNLAKGYNIDIGKNKPLRQVIQQLHAKHSITNEQRRLIENIAAVCNAAIHGETVSQQDAEQIIKSADILAEQFVSWLSWGFNDSKEVAN